mmetsp:Transcript_15865/g.34408  ORF Transcript_15865/g.34408 Transcript_15865/m.34408 type:complete len:351 (-) Transcript_15865:476-1528(-)
MPMSTMSSISTSAKSSISSTPSLWKASMKKPSRSTLSHSKVDSGSPELATSRSLWKRCSSSTCTAATVKRRLCSVGRPIAFRSSSVTSGKSSTASTPSSSNSSTKFSQRMRASQRAGVRLRTSSPLRAATAVFANSSSAAPCFMAPVTASLSRVGCASTATAARKRRRCSGDMPISMRSRSSTSAKSTTRSTPSLVRYTSYRLRRRLSSHLEGVSQRRPGSSGGSGMMATAARKRRVCSRGSSISSRSARSTSRMSTTSRQPRASKAGIQLVRWSVSSHWGGVEQMALLLCTVASADSAESGRLGSATAADMRKRRRCSMGMPMATRSSSRTSRKSRRSRTPMEVNFCSK